MAKFPMSRRHEPRLQLLPGIGLVDLASPELTGRLAGIAAAQLEAFQTTMREGLPAASVAGGLGGWARPPGGGGERGGRACHDAASRTAVRRGREAATVPLGGRRVAVAKPRLRAVDGSG